MESEAANIKTKGLPRVFWVYLAGAGLVAAGFADFPLIAYHFTKGSTVPKDWVPILYAIAMGVSGTGSLVLGRLYDRVGIVLLIPLTLVSAILRRSYSWAGSGQRSSARGYGALGWVCMSQSCPPPLRQWWPDSGALRPTGFSRPATACPGFSAARPCGFLYDQTIAGTIIFCVALQLAAIPVLFIVRRQYAALPKAAA